MDFTPIPYKDVTAAYRAFANRLKTGVLVPKRKLTWRPGNRIMDVYWHEQQDLWAGPGRWCPIGITKPTTTLLRMTCEFNPPQSQNDRRRGMVFVQDARGTQYVAHTGNIGGGKTGVGKHTFLNYYAAEPQEIEWPDGKVSDVIIIGPLHDKTLIDKISEYVHAIARFKASVTTSAPPPPPLKFTPEFFGPRKPYQHTTAIRSINRHGTIVGELHRALTAKGHQAYNDQHVDLFIIKNKRMTHVFEVKTDPFRDSVYKAVGQVMLHGAFERTTPSRIMVMPADVTQHAREGLRRLGIRLLTYQWHNEQPVFDNIDHALT